VEPVVSSRVVVAIVSARGIIDADHVGPFARELMRAAGAGVIKLLVDLSRAEEVTTAGMNALLAADRRQAATLLGLAPNIPGTAVPTVRSRAA